MEYLMTDRMLHWQELLSGLAEWQEELTAGTGSPENAADCLTQLSLLGDLCGLPITDMLSQLQSIMARTDLSQAELNAVRQLSEKMLTYVQKEYDARLYDSPDGLLKEVCIRNCYDTAYPKRALMVYILSPFFFPETGGSHTNVAEARQMAETLRDLSYDVDIVNTYYEGVPDAERYDLVIGFRRPFEELLPRLKKKCLSVYYTTEASPYYANPAELKRILDFEARNGRRMPYERQNFCCQQLDRLLLADGAVCIGNDWTVSTYRGMFRRCLKQNASSTALDRDAAHKEGVPYGSAFLWYGGAGALHKGVDLCIEAFRSLPELTLHLVGRVDGEIGAFYRKEMADAPNIIYHGFLPPDSTEFLELCGICDFSLGVSCSEGQSTAMNTAMRGGVIPVCQPSMGVDAEVSGGVAIGEPTIPELAGKCRELSAMPPGEIDRRRAQVYAYAAEHHSLEAYGKMLKGNLLTLLMEKESREK